MLAELKVLSCCPSRYQFSGVSGSLVAGGGRKRAVDARADGLQAQPGTMVPVRINGADIYDLSGEIVGASEMVASARSSH